jgi:hypothetical protein
MKYHLMNQRLFITFFFWIVITACQFSPPNTPTPDNFIRIESTATDIPNTETPTLTPSPTITSTPVPPTPTLEPIAYGPDNFPEHINPLTGLEASDPDLLDKRPVAVKINLVPRTTYRPTWGLSLADIVWEYYHNDGYTRLHAIFHGKEAELAGAIRSGRMPDHDLVQMYKSIFAYGSADALINFRLLNAAYSDRLVLESQRSDCPPTAERPMCRYQSTGHDLLLTGIQALSQYITNQGVDNNRQNLDGMLFQEIAPENGKSAHNLYIHYSSDSYDRWSFDPRSGRYLLSLDGAMVFNPEEEVYKPLMDRVNDQQIQAENVVILIVRHQYYQPPPNEIVEILLSGTGIGYAARDGEIFEVKWNRPTLDSVLFLTFADGSHYPFKPGSTWYHVIGETSEINALAESGWRFDFRFP